jgi:hypothetical protein
MSFVIESNFCEYEDVLSAMDNGEFNLGAIVEFVFAPAEQDVYSYECPLKKFSSVRSETRQGDLRGGMQSDCAYGTPE